MILFQNSTYSERVKINVKLNTLLYSALHFTCGIGQVFCLRNNAEGNISDRDDPATGSEEE